jgi:hypothetical protein
VVTTTLRRACAQVSESARHVRIDHDRIAAYSATLSQGAELPRPAPDLTDPAERERTAAFWLTLDAINFGSGWFPTLRKGAQRTGYRTIEAGVKRRFDESGPWSAAELGAIEPAELGQLMDQDPKHELMALFASSLQDLGRRLTEQCRGSFAALVDDAEFSAVRLVETLAAWDCFADTSSHGELRLPFLKRAQIAAADLHRAGLGGFSDIEALTMFADNLVPHVLRLDRILRFARGLVERIAAGELIEHGSPEEVEIRACAVQAVELIVAAAPVTLTAAEVDEILWNRGQQPAYKAQPRHRSRTTAY